MFLNEMGIERKRECAGQEKSFKRVSVCIAMCGRFVTVTDMARVMIAPQ